LNAPVVEQTVTGQRLGGTMAAATGEVEFRHGWQAVLACFGVAIFAWGFGFYGQSVYLAELHRLRGWPTSIIGAATTCFYLAGALLVPFVQRTLDRIGPRGLLAGGVLVIGAGALWFASASAEWQLFGAGLVMAVGWAGTSTTAIATTLAMWFDRRRGFAISLALNGASASGFTVAPLLVLLSQTIGLRFAVLDAVLAGWVILLPLVAWCLRRAPAATAARPGARLGGSAALRDGHFWSVALPFALAIAAQVGFIVHMVAFLLPLLGRDGTSLGVTGSSAAAMIGRLALGGVIDRLPRRGTSAVCFLSQALGLGLLLIWPGSEVAIYTGILLFGLSVGNVITLPAVIVQAEFPAASFGTIIGLSGAIGQFTLAFAPGLFGLLHDATGGYAAVLVICMALQASGAVILLAYRRRSGTSIHRPSATLR
jgi:predicted MFS family arabinose efflux permease